MFELFLGGVCNNTPDAVKIFLTDNVEATFGSLNSHQWRLEKFWNEECDTVLKQYMAIIKELYRTYSGINVVPGKPK